MAIEIERKFLATPAALEHCHFGLPIVQGYLFTDAENTVRVRRAGSRAFFAWKGKRTDCSRQEYEHEVSYESANLMLAALRPGRRIEKTRYRVEHAGAIWEVDVFGGLLSGLIVAEIELAHEDQIVTLPSWVGREVTHDERYRNSRLAAQESVPVQLAPEYDGSPSRAGADRGGPCGYEARKHLIEAGRYQPSDSNHWSPASPPRQEQDERIPLPNPSECESFVTLVEGSYEPRPRHDPRHLQPWSLTLAAAGAAAGEHMQQ